MNLSALEVFVAVADQGTLTGAGELLYLSPSGVSGTVKALERELGASLFHRHGRGVTLSDAGLAFLPHARATLAEAAAARDSVRDAKAGLRGRVNLGIMQALRPPAPHPATLLASFRLTHPGVEVRVRHGGGSSDMVALVAAGALDLALVGTASAPRSVVLTPLFSEPIELICAVEHPLAKRPQVDMADLDGEVFAELPTSWGSRTLNETAFAAAGPSRQIRHEINDVATLITFVAQGLAIALLPRSMVQDQPQIAVVPVSDHRHPFTVFLASVARQAHRPTVTALANHIMNGQGEQP